LTQFKKIFAESDKKTYKDNLSKFFGSSETCLDFINISEFPKFDDKAPNAWEDLMEQFDSNGEVKALSQKEEGSIIQGDQIIVDQLR
jgi:hypothetical protein